MTAGETFVATDGSSIVGIITLADAARTHGSPFYDRPDVADLGQFAVRPSHQRRGVGSRLIEIVERRALEQGVIERALTTPPEKVAGTLYDVSVTSQDLHEAARARSR